MLNRVERNVRVFVFHPLGIGPFSLIMLIPHELLGTKKKKKSHECLWRFLILYGK